MTHPTDQPLPEPTLFTHELLNDGKPNGVHLGVTDRRIVEQAYTEGETAKEVNEWVHIDQLRAHVAAERERWAAELARLRAEVEAAEQFRDAISDALQSDLENGVKWLNEIAADNFKSNYPQLHAALTNRKG